MFQVNDDCVLCEKGDTRLVLCRKGPIWGPRSLNPELFKYITLFIEKVKYDCVLCGRGVKYDYFYMDIWRNRNPPFFLVKTYPPPPETPPRIFSCY